MPRKSGQSLIRDIREFEQMTGRKRTPIMVLTGESSPEEKIACLQQYGADEYLVKPVALGLLLQALERLIKMKAREVKPKRVAIIDDELIASSYLRLILESRSHKCDIAGNVEEVIIIVKYVRH